MSKEILKGEKLDNVAGGTRIETFQDGEELVKRGLLNEEDALRAAPVRNLLHKLGYNGYEDNFGELVKGTIRGRRKAPLRDSFSFKALERFFFERMASNQQS